MKPVQSWGAFGPRNFSKKPLEFPIPKYDPGNPLHRRLAELGQEGLGGGHRLGRVVAHADLNGNPWKLLAVPEESHFVAVVVKSVLGLGAQAQGLPRPPGPSPSGPHGSARFLSGLLPGLRRPREHLLLYQPARGLRQLPLHQRS